MAEASDLQHPPVKPGYVWEDGIATIKIPPGIEDGTLVELSGLEGVYARLKTLPHPIFRREGSNLHMEAALSSIQAVLGGTIQVPTVAGPVVTLKIRPRMQPGQVHIMRGKGLPIVNQPGCYGDQYVHFRVNMPLTVPQKQQQDFLAELSMKFAEEEDSGSLSQVTDLEEVLEAYASEVQEQRTESKSRMPKLVFGDVDPHLPRWLDVSADAQEIFITASLKFHQIGNINLRDGPPVYFQLQKEQWLELAHHFLLEKVRLSGCSSSSWNTKAQLEKLEQWTEPWFFTIVGGPVVEIFSDLRSAKLVMDEHGIEQRNAALRGFINCHLRAHAYENQVGAYWSLFYIRQLLSQLLRSRPSLEVYELVLEFVRDFWIPQEFLDEAKAWAAFYMGLGLKELDSSSAKSWFEKSLNLGRSYNVLSQASEMLGDCYLELELNSENRKRAQTCFGIQHWAAVKLERKDIALHALRKLFDMEFYAGNIDEAEKLVVGKLRPERIKGSPYVVAAVLEMQACVNFARKKYRDAEMSSLGVIRILEPLSSHEVLQKDFKPYFDTQPQRPDYFLYPPDLIERNMESTQMAWSIVRLSREFSTDHEGAEKAEESLQKAAAEHVSVKPHDELLHAEIVRSRARHQIYNRRDLENGESSTALLLEICSRNMASKRIRTIIMPEALSFVAALRKAYAKNEGDGGLHSDMILDSILTAESVPQWITPDMFLKSRRTKVFRPLQREQHLLCWYQQEFGHRAGPNIDTYDVLWADLEAMYKSAREDTVFLVYLWDWVYPFEELPSQSKMHSYLLHSTGGVEWLAQDVGKLYAKVYEMRKNLSDGEDITDCLEDLHQLLIAPWSEKLQRLQATRIVVIPTSVVAMVPFAALLDPEDGLYLVEKYAISYSPSLKFMEKFLGRIKKEQGVVEQAVVIGNPDNSLDYAEDEAILVANKLKRGGSCHVNLLLGPQGRKRYELEQTRAAATGSEVMRALTSSGWLHIAGHAAIDDEFPYGAIHLEDGPLSVEEIESQLGGSNSRSSSYGVMLSACSTALGKIGMEGVTGLCKCFHDMGVSVVVASLWNVDDFETHLLVDKFYSEVCDGVDVAKALQSAMKSMIGKKNFIGAPAYSVDQWAAFSVSGSLYASLST